MYDTGTVVCIVINNIINHALNDILTFSGVLSLEAATEPRHESPWPRDHGIYNFGRSFLGYHYYVLRLPDVSLGLGTLIFKQMYKSFYYHVYVAYPVS